MFQFPQGFIASVSNAGGFDEENFIRAHDPSNLITSVRFNPASNKITAAENLPFGLGEKIPWTSESYYLNERPSFITDPFWHAGVYYVQEASSMFLEQVIKQTTGLNQRLRVLDVCAAPGGKSTLLQSLLSPESLLVSNEVIKSRSNILTENITKWGAANVVVSNNDPGDFNAMKEWFDVIVVDAPCSGSGLFRKDPGAMQEWSPANVDLCAQRQKRILASVIPALKPGGVLVYSTCSYATAENEAMLDWMLDIEDANLNPAQISGTKEFGIVEVLSDKHRAHGYRFYPDKVKGEGFFIAAMKKDGEWRPGPGQNSKAPRINAHELSVVGDWLMDKKDTRFLKLQDTLLAVPEAIFNDILFLQSKLYLRKAGVETGTVIRNELIPAHALALSNLLETGVPHVDVDMNEALQFLRRADWSATTGGKGWMVVRYQGIALGWIKAMPGRVNNYYPREWRILNK